MTDKPMDWEAIYSLVDHAQELPPAQREAYLQSSCKGDENLRMQVRKILGAEVHGKFLEPPSRLGQGLFGGGLQGKRMGRYQLEREIARGGMGVIYLANEIQDEQSSAHEQAFLGEQVVVKVLPQIQRTQPEIFARFQREAQAASKLQHPHALRVLDSGETEGVAWYAMPFVEGHDLHQEIRNQRSNSKQSLWPAYGRRKYIARAVEEVAGIADALHGYHSKGITHRDIKPRNLLLNLSGHLMLADFGLAKISDLETLTQLGAVQGTPHYMSPEQTRIMRSPIDQRTDIYSLCVVLYELLALTRPYEAKSADVVVSLIASGMHVPLRKASPRTPRDLALICEKGMAHKPRDRYQTAEELSKDLRRFLSLEAVLAKPAPLAQRAKRFLRSHRIAIGGALLLLATSVAWLASNQWQQTRALRATWRDAFEAVALQDPAPDSLQKANAALKAMLRTGYGPTTQSTIARAVIDQDHAARHTQMQRLLDRGKGRGLLHGRFEDYRLPTDQLSLVRAHHVAQESSIIFPEDAVFARYASVSTLLPALTIRFEDEPLGSLHARAWAYPLDIFTSLHGRAIDLGKLPVMEHSLSVGEWRIAVQLSNGTLLEFDRVIHPRRSEYHIKIRAPQERPAKERMILIKPKDNRFPTVDPLTGEETTNCCYSPGDLPLANYWIDQAVVSNGEYLQYLIDSGAPAPPLWHRACVDQEFSGNWRELPIGDVGAGWLDLPATGIPCIEAQHYAEFYGMRLASHYEMEFALRGPELLRAPWGEGPRPDSFHANVGSLPAPLMGTDREKYQMELAHLMPARLATHAHAPFGLHHAFGNVNQRTWGVAMFPTDNGQQKLLIKHVGDRLVFGASYSAWDQGGDFFSHKAAGQARSATSWGIGFRCVRSAQLPPTTAR